MPCDSISIFSAHLENLKNWDTLETAARAAGWYVYRTSQEMTLTKGRETVRIRKGGVAEISGAYMQENRSQEIASELTKAYTKQVVKAASKKFGWQLEEKSGKLRLKRRY
ncbi:MAG: hypothetical protein GYA36_19110 [Veillonellaceae bacterium]|nr:hypothetical protein [Veillonellaceae bacterium]